MSRRLIDSSSETLKSAMLEKSGVPFGQLILVHISVTVLVRGLAVRPAVEVSAGLEHENPFVYVDVARQIAVMGTWKLVFVSGISDFVCNGEHI